MPRGAEEEGLLVVAPTEGLANRLRVLVSAMLLAEDAGLPLLVRWRRAPACGCDLSDVLDAPRPFDVADGPVDVRGLEDGVAWARARAGADGTVGTAPPGTRLVVESFAEFYPARPEGKAHDPCCAGAAEDPHRARRAAALQRLRPAAASLAAAPDVPPRTLGVHVRRTDNAPAVLYSPLTAFTEAMRAARDAGEAERFLVRSDEPDDLAALAARGYELVAPVPPGTPAPERGTAVGVQAALADIVALSRCSAVVGSHGSAFSYVAALWGGVPHTVAYRAVDPHDSAAMSDALRYLSQRKLRW